MSGQPIPVGAQAAPDPGPIFETATGFMRAKHLFVAGELGIFEVLADGGFYRRTPLCSAWRMNCSASSRSRKRSRTSASAARLTART